MKIYYAIFVLVFLIGCASDPSNSKSNDYLSEKDNESLEDLIDTDVNNSLDLVPNSRYKYKTSSISLRFTLA